MDLVACSVRPIRCRTLKAPEAMQNLECRQSVVDIDGTATFIDPGNIAKEKKVHWTQTLRLISAATYEKKPGSGAKLRITHVNSHSAPVLFINSSGNAHSSNGEEMSAKLRALGIESEIVVIPNTPHPFWLFHPWFEPTVQQWMIFLKRTLK